MNDKLRKLLVDEDVTVKDALKKMGEAGEKILFVTSDDGRLLGTVTDGDVRRWILKEGSLGEKLSCVFNRSPKKVFEDYDVASVKETMLSEKLESLPVVNEDGMLVDVVLWSDIFSETMKSKSERLNAPVLVMAGGKGTRMDPFTRILPKPLIPLGDKPVIEIIMDKFADHGCDKFYLTVNYKGRMVQSYFDNNSECSHTIKYIWEDKPCGTAGGIKLAADLIEGDHIFVSNCDILVKADYHDIFKFHVDKSNDITIVGSMKHFTVPYGVLEVKNGGFLRDIVEKPEYDLLVNTGLYLIKKDVIGHIPSGVSFDFPELIDSVRKDGGKIGVYPVGQHTWIDVGQWQEYHGAIKEFEK